MASILRLGFLFAVSASALASPSNHTQFQGSNLNTTYFKYKGLGHEFLQKHELPTQSSDICSPITVTSTFFCTKHVETFPQYGTEIAVHDSVKTIDAGSTVFITVGSIETSISGDHTATVTSTLRAGMTVTATVYMHDGTSLTSYMTASGADGITGDDGHAAATTTNIPFSSVSRYTDSSQGLNIKNINSTIAPISGHLTTISVPLSTVIIATSNSSTTVITTSPSSSTSTSASTTTSLAVTLSMSTTTPIPMTFSTSMAISSLTTLSTSMTTSTLSISTTTPTPTTSSTSTTTSSTTTSSITISTPICRPHSLPQPTFYLLGMDSGNPDVDQNFVTLVASPDGTGLVMQFTADESEAAIFAFNAGNCEVNTVDLNYPNTISGEIHTALKFDTPDGIQNSSGSWGVCFLMYGELNCDVEDQSTFYVCPSGSPTVEIGPDVASGCSALVLTAQTA